MPIIQGTAISEQILIKIMDDIQNKKELGPVERSIVREVAVKELQSDYKLTRFIAEHDEKTVDRSEKYKSLIKKVRSKLRKAYGVFQVQTKKDRWLLLEELKIALSRKHNLEATKDIHLELLRTHLSTKERMMFYDDIYSKIWSITGKPRTLIDIGCGINPMSYPFMGIKKLDYYASELNFQDVRFLNSYFDIMEKFGLDGKAIQQDLRDIATNPELFKAFPRCDVCFMFKLFDSVKVLGKNKRMEETAIEKAPAKYIVMSFATKTMGARSMSVTKRDWLEKICQRHKWDFEKFDVENEVFYVIKK